jgi:hypothetical protein
VGPATDWQPGDPVYGDERRPSLKHCGPCLVAWTADVHQCPHCEQMCTEMLRVELATLRADRDRVAPVVEAARALVERYDDALYREAGTKTSRRLDALASAVRALGEKP